MIFLPFAFATSVINKWHEGQISAIQYAVAAYGPLWWASLHKLPPPCRSTMVELAVISQHYLQLKKNLQHVWEVIR
jgi:hypothetical protein